MDGLNPVTTIKAARLCVFLGYVHGAIRGISVRANDRSSRKIPFERLAAAVGMYVPAETDAFADRRQVTNRGKKRDRARTFSAVDAAVRVIGRRLLNRARDGRNKKNEKPAIPSVWRTGRRRGTRNSLITRAAPDPLPGGEFVGFPCLRSERVKKPRRRLMLGRFFTTRLL